MYRSTTEMYKRQAMKFNYDILIVDDIVENIQVAMNILKGENYNFAFAKSGKEALVLLKGGDFDLVLLDIMMPELDGLETFKIMKQDPKLKDIPVIFLTAKTDIDTIEKAFALGAVDHITKPFHPSELLARVRTHLELYRARKILELNNISLKTQIVETQQRIRTELEMTQQEIIDALMEVVESVSDETGRHVKRVADISRMLARKSPILSAEDEELIHLTAPMHDIGKLFIPQEILHKPGKLTEAEFEIVKTHTTKAHRILKISNRKVINAADIIATQHHEKWDGSGYPYGLKAEEIHPFGRVVAIADVLDALTHKRVYKDAWSIDEACEYIVERRGKQFDPDLVDILINNKEEFRAIVDES